MEKIIKIKNIKSAIKKYNYDQTKIGIEIDGKIYYDNKNNPYKYNDEYYWYPMIAQAINIKDQEKKYKYIYETMCEILDNISKQCDFKCDQCKANRNGLSVNKIDGCCYFKEEGRCKYLKDKKCTNPNISCKLFMCEYIEKEMKFKSVPKNYPLLDLFFNKKQKEILQHSYKKNFEALKNILIDKKM